MSQIHFSQTSGETRVLWRVWDSEWRSEARTRDKKTHQTQKTYSDKLSFMIQTSTLPTDWHEFLKQEFKKEYFQNITKKIQQDIDAWITLYPPLERVFEAFSLTPLSNLKVVILGQDPYHGPNQAHWLSFSVECEKLPPSLKNMYKELESDLWISPSKSGNLTPWASQWVLMMNAILTVQAWLPASHAKIWWETFTDTVISEISKNTSGVIFVLWGNFARRKKSLIDTSKHFILESAHPSPFSAYNGFFGSKVFSSINEILKTQNKTPINWEL